MNNKPLITTDEKDDAAIARLKQENIELKKELHRLSMVVEGTKAGYWDWDIETGNVTINNAWAEMIGYTAEELGQISLSKWESLCQTEDLREATVRIESHFRGETGHYEAELRMRHKKGHWVWILSRGKVFERNGEGQPIRMAGAHQEITERKHAEEKIRQEMNLFLEGPVTAFRWLNTQGYPVEYVSPNVTMLAGFAPTDFTSGIIGYADIIHPDDLDRILDEMASYSSDPGRTSFVQEYRIICKEGKIAWIYDFTTIIRDENGRITCYEGYVFDNTIRKLSEAALAYNRQLEHLISTLANQFINATADRIDAMIDKALQAIGKFVQADRSYIFQYYDNLKLMNNTHEWCSEGIEPQIDILQQLPASDFRWTNRKIIRNEVIIVPRVSELPDEAASEREILQRKATKSVILIPLVSSGTTFGFIGVDAVKKTRQWPSSSASILALAGGIIANALQRKQVEMLIQQELDLALKLSASQSFDETVRHCLQTAIEISEMDCGGIYLFNDAENTLNLVASQGVPEEFINKASTVMPDSPEYLVLTSGNLLYSDQLPHNNDRNSALQEEGLKAFALLPVIGKNRVIGTLIVASHSLSQVHEFARKTLETVASHIGAAIMQAQHEEQSRTVSRNLETLFESIDDMLIVFDHDSAIVHANTATINTLGYSLDQLRTMTVLDVHPPELREQTKKRVAEMLADIETTCDIPLFMKSGERVPVETKITHGTWDEKPVIFCISRDISERLKSLSAIVESERKFRKLTEYLPLTLFETDRQGIVTYINQSGQAFFNLSADELQQGISAFSFCIPEEIELALANQTKILEPGYIPKGNEYTVIMKDGRRVPLLLYSTPISQEDGQVSGIRTTVVDLTELKLAEDALRENALQKRITKEFKSIIDNIPGVVYHTSKDGTIKFLSEAKPLPSTHNLIFALSSSFEKALSFIHPDDHKIVADAHRELRESPVSKIVVFRIAIPGEDIRWIENRKTSVFSENGDFLGIDGILLDITDRVKAQEEKQQLEKNLKKSQRLETIGTLAGGIAHDFNNILTPILGYAEMGVAVLNDDNALHDYFSEIMKAAERARHLVAQILSFSRAEEYEPVVVNVKEIVNEAMKLLRPSIPVTITIRKTIGEQCGNVFADPTQIHQVIVNLCTNAFQSMAESGGELAIDLREIVPDSAMRRRIPTLRRGRYLQLTIADTGHGMDEATMERIFEPFFTTRAVNKGTGLGLSVVHGIVTSYKGEITVESTPGKGTIFQVYLPAIKSDAMTENHEREFGKGLKSTRILFVDDEPATLHVMNVMMSHLGLSVRVVNSPVEALDEFRKQPEAFDMVITDLTMPEMTGIELARGLHEISPGLPVALMTGYGKDIEYTVPLSQYGICKLLKKPVSLSNLSQAITEVMAAAAQA